MSDTAIERLASRIDTALRRGERSFLLEGAELDWVIEAIRAANRSQRGGQDMNCEMCQERVARWHQRQPVERWLCLECAHRDHKACPYGWEGDLHPIGGTYGEKVDNADSDR